MGRTDFGSRSPKHCVRFKNSISLCSVSKASSNYSGSPGISPNSRYRSSTPSGKGGCLPGAPNKGYLLQSFIFSPQKRRGHATSDRHQLPQSVHRQHTLSNGAPINHKISFENRSLHDQTRLERCLPFGTDSPGLPKISTVHLERQNLPVPSAPLRVEHSPSSVHTVAKTSSSLSTGTWSSPCDLSRRHSHYRILCGGDTPVHRNDYVSPRILRVHHQQREVHLHPNSDNYLSGIHNQLDHHATNSTSGQSEECALTLSSNAFQAKSVTPLYCSNLGPARVISASHMASSSSYAQATGATDTGTTKFPTKLQGGSESLASLEIGAAMVDTEHRTLQWKPCHDHSTRSHDLHGCVKTGMGCSLRQSASEQEMVSYRETSTHQYSRIERCLSGHTSSFEEQTFYDGVPQYGQFFCRCIYQSQRRDTLASAASSHPGSLGVVHPEGYIPCSTSCPREVEQPCRSRIAGLPRQQRLDVGSQHNQTPVGTLPNRPVRDKANSPISDLRQLEARPQGSPIRRIQSELEGSEGICISTIQPDRKSTEQNIGRPNRDFAGSSNMVGTTLVPSTPPITDSATSSSAGLTTSSNRSLGSRGNSPDVSTSSPGRIPYLLQRYKAEGLPTDIAKLLIAATRSSTHKMYESSWKRWRSWCCTRKIDPVSASLKDILTFLADTFNSGLQYRSINVLRSALSVTLPNIDGYSVGQHPYVVNILRGILNERPPKPRYSQTWDVTTAQVH